jgi:hypothetical protein
MFTEARAMSEIAAGLGSVICRSIIGIGFSGTRCYDWGTQQRLGFAVAAVLLVIGAAGLQRFGRWS